MKGNLGLILFLLPPVSLVVFLVIMIGIVGHWLISVVMCVAAVLMIVGWKLMDL